MNMQRKVYGTIVLTALSVIATVAMAQTTVIVPWPAGGGLDVMARTLAQKVGEQGSETVIVDNRPGANGRIGASLAAKSKPDGRTWLADNGTVVTVNPVLYPKDPNFDPERDLRVVAALGFQASLLVAHPGAGLKSVKDFVAGASVAEMPYASGGIGSTGHLTMEYFSSVAKLKLRHVAYKGGAPAMNDLVGGQVPVAFVALPNALPFVKSGKLVALAVSSPARSPQLPEVPTMQEAGYAGFEVETAFFLLVPAKTPDAIARSIEERITRALADPAVQERIRSTGIEPAKGMSVAAANAWLKSDAAKWAKLIPEAGIKAE